MVYERVKKMSPILKRIVAVFVIVAVFACSGCSLIPALLLLRAEPAREPSPAPSSTPAATPKATPGPSNGGKVEKDHHTRPSAGDQSDFIYYAPDTLLLFGDTPDMSSLPIEKLMKYYYLVGLKWEVLNNVASSGGNYEGWTEYVDGDVPVCVMTCTAEELREWFESRLGVAPDLSAVDRMTLKEPDEGEGSFAVKADYIAASDSVEIRVEGEIDGNDGFRYTLFEPFYECTLCIKDPDRYEYQFVVCRVTKEKPSDMEGVNSREIIEASMGPFPWWGWADFFDQMSEEVRRQQFPAGTKISRSTVYYVPVADIFAEHIEGAFRINSLRTRPAF